jgi:nitrous oxidase accessory protein NosD
VRGRRAAAVLVVVLVALAFVGVLAGRHDDGACTRWAAPGATGGDGSRDAPFGDVDRLADALEPGDTGCLSAGVHVGDVTLGRGGRAGARVELRPAPGARATVRGRLLVTRSAPFVTVRGLRLEGVEQGALCGPEPCPSPTVNADDVAFVDNDVTNDHTAICFVLGDRLGRFGRADRVELRGNRIHDCGTLPRTNLEHGIYAQATTGARIVGNLIDGNADRGLQLYSDVQGALVAGNVLTGNGTGIIFSGLGGSTSNGTVVEHNVIADSRARWNVESFYAPGTTVARGNVVRENCLAARDPSGPYGRDGGDQGGAGYHAQGNRVVDDPGIVPGARRPALKPGSPCRGLLRAPDGR